MATTIISSVSHSALRPCKGSASPPSVPGSPPGASTRGKADFDEKLRGRAGCLPSTSRTPAGVPLERSLQRPPNVALEQRLQGLSYAPGAMGTWADLLASLCYDGGKSLIGASSFL